MFLTGKQLQLGDEIHMQMERIWTINWSIGVDKQETAQNFIKTLFNQKQISNNLKNQKPIAMFNLINIHIHIKNLELQETKLQLKNTYVNHSISQRLCRNASSRHEWDRPYQHYQQIGRSFPHSSSSLVHTSWTSNCPRRAISSKSRDKRSSTQQTSSNLILTLTSTPQ